MGTPPGCRSSPCVRGSWPDAAVTRPFPHPQAGSLTLRQEVPQLSLPLPASCGTGCPVATARPDAWSQPSHFLVPGSRLGRTGLSRLEEGPSHLDTLRAHLGPGSGRFAGVSPEGSPAWGKGPSRRLESWGLGPPLAGGAAALGGRAPGVRSRGRTPGVAPAPRSAAPPPPPRSPSPAGAEEAAGPGRTNFLRGCGRREAA